MRDDQGRAAVMLERMSNGHFEVRAEINGTPVTLLVDTGATNTVLSAADAGRAGIDPATLDYNVAVMTANGEARAARVTANEIRVGGHRAEQSVDAGRRTRPARPQPARHELHQHAVGLRHARRAVESCAIEPA